MFKKKSEKGQAIIIIVFSIIGIIGLTALTVDGGIAYSDRRNAQGAADSAAWAGGLSNARGGSIDDIILAAEEIADQNGYTGDGARSDVTVTVTELPMAPAPITLPNGSTAPNPCPEHASPNVEITVEIISYVNTFFAPVIGVNQITNRVSAVTIACGTYKAAIFGGYAIASCGRDLNDQHPCGFDSGQSSASDWTVTGSGLHSDTCVHGKDDESITLEPGQCLDSVSGVTGGVGDLSCGEVGQALCTDAYLAAVMPPNPCVAGGVGLPQSDAVSVSSGTGKDKKTSLLFGDGTSPKIYCITDADGLEGGDVILNNATLYFTETEFDLKFAGGGGFSGTPSKSGTYSGLAIIVTPADPPCPGTSGTGANNAQQFEYRGNATGILYGTVLAPTACIDMRGNSGDGGKTETPLNVNGQVIGNSVTSNGTASITVNYVEEQNYRPPEMPTIILAK